MVNTRFAGTSPNCYLDLIGCPGFVNFPRQLTKEREVTDIIADNQKIFCLQPVLPHEDIV
jgi:hypothetical protein